MFIIDEHSDVMSHHASQNRNSEALTQIPIAVFSINALLPLGGICNRLNTKESCIFETDTEHLRKRERVDLQ